MAVRVAPAASPAHHAPGEGITPNNRMSVIVSISEKISTILPSAMQLIMIASNDTWRPVAGMPRKSPLCVPV